MANPKERGHHHMLMEYGRRIADLERRLTNTVRAAKINDVDEENWRVRVVYSPNADDEPVLSGWIPWQEEAGNIRSWRPPSVGEQVIMLSLSGEIGGAGHTWISRGGFTTEDGELIDTKAFQPSQDTRDETRDSIEVVETRNSTGELGTGGAKPNQSQGEPGPTGQIFSRLKTAEAENFSLVKRSSDDDGEQTKNHADVWHRRDSGVQVESNSAGQHIVTSEDKSSGRLTVSDQRPGSHDALVQDETKATLTSVAGGLHQLSVVDGALAPSKPLTDKGGDNSSPADGNTQVADSTVQTITPGVHEVTTEILGASKVTTRQSGGYHDISADHDISRSSLGSYVNTALAGLDLTAIDGNFLMTAAAGLLKGAAERIRYQGSQSFSAVAAKGGLNIGNSVEIWGGDEGGGGPSLTIGEAGATMSGDMESDGYIGSPNIKARIGSRFYHGDTAPPLYALAEDGSVILREDYAELDAVVYCGDANNATAGHYYHCTNPGDPSGSRSPGGDYLVLADRRGEFDRGWDAGRGVDAGRDFWAWQNHALEGTTIPANITGLQYEVHILADTGVPAGGETRGRNVAGLACIWYG